MLFVSRHARLLLTRRPRPLPAPPASQACRIGALFAKHKKVHEQEELLRTQVGGASAWTHRVWGTFFSAGASGVLPTPSSLPASRCSCRSPICLRGQVTCVAAGTPNRLCKLADSGALRLDRLKHVVLDVALDAKQR